MLTKFYFFHVPRHHNATGGNGASTWTGSGTAAKSCRQSCHHKTATAAANLDTIPEPGDGVTAASPTSRRATTRAAGSTAPPARRGRPAGAGGTAEPEAAVPGLMSQLREIVNDAVREALQTVPPPAGDTAPATAVAPDSAPAGVSLLRGADGAVLTIGIQQP